ncbi:MAG TPA: PLDc N-terminal domain-containing protein [Candidatus Saccharibacteria bacterium]|nr:PLDc N-terminal domain-containing protein [Candidatus Saccharibacteria bacterium]
MEPLEILRLLWPLIAFQIAFQAYALFDLFKFKKKKTRNLSVIHWTIIIIVGEIVGPALYFLFGRSEI